MITNCGEITSKSAWAFCLNSKPVDIPAIIRRLDKTPVTTGNNPFAKSKSVAYDVRKLFKYFTIPTFFVIEKDFKRQLVFQYNISTAEDFYLLNVKAYQNGLANFLIAGGCLCIKFRVDETVYRYKLLDHSSGRDWSYFELYTNQRIKKNFCIEFWADDFVNADEVRYGLLQDITFQTSSIYNPTNIPESAVDTQIDEAAIQDRNDLAPVDNGVLVIHLLAGLNGDDISMIVPDYSGPVFFVIWNGTATQTAAAIAVSVNAGTIQHGYSATSSGAFVYIIPPINVNDLVASPDFVIVITGGSSIVFNQTVQQPASGIVNLPYTQNNLVWLNNDL